MKFTFGNLPALGWKEPVERIVDVARVCEEVGFDRFGVADYRFYNDCIVVMTACLQATSRLEVESLVTDPYVRHPSLTAAAFATMDDLAPGRAILGIGGGLEQPAFWGESRPHPVDGVREAIDICRRMWRGEEVTAQGRVFSTYGARMNFSARPDIKVLIAARGRRMLRLAGEVADVVHLAAWFLNVAHFRDNVAEVRRGAERAGRQLGDFEIDFSVPACISENRDHARRAAKRFAARGMLWMAGAEKYSRNRADWQPPAEFRAPVDLLEALATRWDTWHEADLPPDLAERITDEMVDQFAVAGEPEECAERITQLVLERPEATGVRIQAYAPEHMSSFEGYRETALGMRRAIEKVRAAVAGEYAHA
jgi:5,10-methylenetetrahydromethanopterin reductase